LGGLQDYSGSTFQIEVFDSLVLSETRIAEDAEIPMPVALLSLPAGRSLVLAPLATVY